MTRSSRNHVSRTLPPKTGVIGGVPPVERSPAQVARRFRALVESGARLFPAGLARRDPDLLLSGHYVPRHEIDLFDASYYLTDLLFDDALRFFIGYVTLGEKSSGRVSKIHPRIFYKDSSLMWRVASHFVHDHEEYWIGKGDTRTQRIDGEESLYTAEETTDLPFEIQTAFDLVSRRRKRRRDDDAVGLVLREAPSGRLEPYADFIAPRRRAASRHKIHGGRRIARFLRAGDPGSLRFASGFQPDFDSGVLERATTVSPFYGGDVHKIRILSINRQIQYLFFASPTHVWLNPPQALTTELTSYGVRAIDVLADEDIFLPGYEYHEAGGKIPHSQIPSGYAGAPHPDDPGRADASAWIEALPVIVEFRATVLGNRSSP